MFAWVNDEDSKRAYESADDAYRVFLRRLDSGRPPSDWGSCCQKRVPNRSALAGSPKASARTSP
ncbi:MAG: type II toxin-antitoxin system YhaV family toxin [Rubrivivax sp.]